VKIFIFQKLELIFDKLQAWAEAARCHFAVCPDCGENRYTGKACVSGKSD
jgi:hypothetical protein